MWLPPDACGRDDFRELTGLLARFGAAGFEEWGVLDGFEALGALGGFEAFFGETTV